MVQDYPELTKIATLMVSSGDDEHISRSDDKVLLLTVPRCNRIPSPVTAKLRDTVIQTIIGKRAGKDLENYQVWTSTTCKTAEKATPNLLLKTISGKIPVSPDNLIHI